MRCLVLPALLAALLASGCGGDDDGGDGESTGTGASKPPSAKEPLRAAAERLESALPGGECKELIGLMLHSIQRGTTNPVAAPKPADCRYIETEAREQLRGYRVTKTREFGTAGFSEGTGDAARRDEVIGIVWLLDSDRSWKAVFEATYRPQLDVPPRLVKEAYANAQQFVVAVRAGDCTKVWAVFGVDSRFVRGAGGRRAKFCRDFSATAQDPKSAFAQIKADPRVKLELLGRTLDLAFYSLELSNGRYMALVLSGPLSNVAPEEIREHANPGVLELVTVRQPP